jgi:hypothetical protein
LSVYTPAPDGNVYVPSFPVPEYGGFQQGPGYVYVPSRGSNGYPNAAFSDSSYNYFMFTPATVNGRTEITFQARSDDEILCTLIGGGAAGFRSDTLGGGGGGAGGIVSLRLKNNELYTVAVGGANNGGEPASLCNAGCGYSTELQLANKDTPTKLAGAYGGTYPGVPIINTLSGIPEYSITVGTTESNRNRGGVGGGAYILSASSFDIVNMNVYTTISTTPLLRPRVGASGSALNTNGTYTGIAARFNTSETRGYGYGAGGVSHAGTNKGDGALGWMPQHSFNMSDIPYSYTISGFTYTSADISLALNSTPGPFNNGTEGCAIIRITKNLFYNTSAIANVYDYPRGTAVYEAGNSSALTPWAVDTIGRKYYFFQNIHTVSGSNAASISISGTWEISATDRSPVDFWLCDGDGNISYKVVQIPDPNSTAVVTYSIGSTTTINATRLGGGALSVVTTNLSSTTKTGNGLGGGVAGWGTPYQTQRTSIGVVTRWLGTVQNGVEMWNVYGPATNVILGHPWYSSDNINWTKIDTNSIQYDGVNFLFYVPYNRGNFYIEFGYVVPGTYSNTVIIGSVGNFTQTYTFNGFATTSVSPTAKSITCADFVSTYIKDAMLPSNVLELSPSLSRRTGAILMRF